MDNNNFKFRALEIHTLHVRDFTGEKIVQAVGEIKEFEIARAAAELELQAFIQPLKLILNNNFKFIILILIGLILIFTLTASAQIFMIKALGFIAVFAGLAAAAASVKDILNRRRFLLDLNNLDHEDALRHAAWQLALKAAPKKFNNDRDESDIDYILIDDDNLRLDIKALAAKYNLLNAIAAQAYEIIHDLN